MDRRDEIQAFDGELMKSKELVDQLKDIMVKTESVVLCAHELLRQNNITQSKFMELKVLADKAQNAYRNLSQDESR